MNLMQHGYGDNRNNVLHYRDIGTFIIAQPYLTVMMEMERYLLIFLWM